MIKIELKILIAAVFILVGIGFIGKGLTGMHSISPSQKTICTADIDCELTEVCCNFYKTNMGICNDIKNCQAIAEATKQEKFDSITGSFLEVDQTNSRSLTLTKNYFSMILGFIIMLIGMVIYLQANYKK